MPASRRLGLSPRCDFGGSAGTDAFASEVIALVKGQRLKKTSAILAIGDQLCNGEYHNTNITEVSKHVHGLGYKVREHAGCTDQRHLIARALSRFLGQYALVVVSGRLGPTSDDITRFSVADATMSKLEFREDCWEQIVRRMQYFKLPGREEDKVQALIPAGATVNADPLNGWPAWQLFCCRTRENRGKVPRIRRSRCAGPSKTREIHVRPGCMRQGCPRAALFVIMF